ncbi:hypothetical protein [Sphingobium sp. Z007]|uniref:hypothetical protein n=1 Tax=Sphingobium sp. Z007 TaxID=627495 RepID=UPI001124D87A|nr:hypothetical protein [Sphingobium sp. Z007]
MSLLRSSTWIATAQVAMMPVIFVTTLLCTMAFVVFTALAIVAAIGILFFTVPSSTLQFVDILFATASLLLWGVACSGVVLGLSAVSDPTLRRTAIIIAHAGICWADLAILFGKLW